MNATPANVAAAQAIVPSVRLPFANFQGTIAQMLRPFPQYGGISDPYGNVGQVNYHALQASLQQRLSNGLTFNVNYTFSKAIGNIFGIRSAYLGQLDKTISNTDMPHVFNAFFSYDLPFGKGKMLDAGNSVARALLDGWTFSGITRFASGIPLGPFIGTCTLPQAGTCYTNYNPAFSGSVRINGDWGDGQVLGPVANTTPFIDKNAFVNAPAFTYGNTPVLGAYGLRSQHLVNTDLGIARSFQVRENLKFVFGADAFNIFNYVRFGMAANYNNITNLAFGKVGSQNNLPRVFQFKFRLEYRSVSRRLTADYADYTDFINKVGLPLPLGEVGPPLPLGEGWGEGLQTKSAALPYPSQSEGNGTDRSCAIGLTVSSLNLSNRCNLRMIFSPGTAGVPPALSAANNPFATQTRSTTPNVVPDSWAFAPNPRRVSTWCGATKKLRNWPNCKLS